MQDIEGQKSITNARLVRGQDDLRQEPPEMAVVPMHSVNYSTVTGLLVSLFICSFARIGSFRRVGPISPKDRIHHRIGSCDSQNACVGVATRSTIGLPQDGDIAPAVSDNCLHRAQSTRR